MSKGLCILGATGSIGQSTLRVVDQHPNDFSVVALSAHKRLDQLLALAKKYRPAYVICGDPADQQRLQDHISTENLHCKVLAGQEGLEQAAQLPEVDMVMAAIVGAAGLRSTYAAAKAGKRLLLANKEALVMTGELLMQAVRDNGAELLPVDSEHNAIFQCLMQRQSSFAQGGSDLQGVSKILLTASGGPFLDRDLDTFSDITPAQACKHPNWSMGQKISVDSATMMNKGLEFIEAHWLFAVPTEDIEIVVHPQSIIHSMVQYSDGSVLAQLGQPDMCTPIAYAMSFPKRMSTDVAPLDFTQLSQLSFCAPDWQRFPNLKLAIDAAKLGQYATTSLNAANEIAVDAFLQEKIRFTDIAKVNQLVLQQTNAQRLNDLASVLACDDAARQEAKQAVAQLQEVN